MTHIVLVHFYCFIYFCVWMYYNLSMHFAIDGLLVVVVMVVFFCYFKNVDCTCLLGRIFRSGIGASQGSGSSSTSLDFAKLLSTVFAPTYTPVTVLTIRTPHPLQYSILSDSSFCWSDGSETCLSVDAIEVKHLFKGLLTISLSCLIFFLFVGSLLHLK